MSNQQLYRFLKTTAIVLTVAFIGWSFYDYLIVSKQPGDYSYHAASNYFSDGFYAKALQEYEATLTQAPDHLPAKRGRAETLIMLDRAAEAIDAYNELILLQAGHAGHYANRGIAYDHLGEHQKALQDYKKALAMDSEITEGPGWLTRFLRNQAEKPPGIADRAAYLIAQFKLPAEQRVLRLPELDQTQRPYKE